MTRLQSRFLVDLLIRRAEAAGGFAAILASGDADAGAILVQCSDRGASGPLLERRFALTGGYLWEAVGPDESADAATRAAYVERRRIADPDLWIVELDIANAPQLVAEWGLRSEEHTSELQSLMRLSYAVFFLTKKITHNHQLIQL